MARTVSVMGDSISTLAGANPAGYAVYYEGERAQAAGVTEPAHTWWQQVAEHLGAVVLANASYSGSMVEGAGFPAGVSPRRAADLCADGREPSCVLVFMGTNDYGWGSARAQAAGRSAATPPCVDLAQVPEEVAGAACAADLAGFEEAYARMLAGVRAACPRAEVWCVPLLAGRMAGSAAPTFAWNLRGVPMASYNAAIARAAAACGARLADAAAFGLDYEAVDGTHPTRRGMRQLAALVEAAMDGAVAPDPGPFEPEGSAFWASRALCGGRSCLGCTWAKGTGNAWYCVCQRPSTEA